MKIIKEQYEAIYNLLETIDFELWNEGCTHRLRIDFSGKICVYPYYDSLHSEKEFKTIKGAINYMIKKDK